MGRGCCHQPTQGAGAPGVQAKLHAEPAPPALSCWPTLSSFCAGTSRAPSTSTSCRTPPATSSPTLSSVSRSDVSCASRNASRWGFLPRPGHLPDPALRPFSVDVRL